MIKNRWTGKIIFEDKKAKSFKEEVEIAIREGISLHSANMRGANMLGANMRDTNMRDADMRDTNMRL